MKRKTSFNSLFLIAFLAMTFLMTSQLAFAEMTLNDNVNIEGDVFLEGDNCGINFSDGSRQTTGAIPPWSQKIPEGRFVLVLDDEAVLDQETGLVWQRDTSDTTCTWINAVAICYTLELGGRKGWRMPTVDELATLIDSTSSNPALPIGHSFTNVKSSLYWSSTTGASNTLYVWVVYFHDGYIGGNAKTDSWYVRAVRSGQ